MAQANNGNITSVDAAGNGKDPASKAKIQLRKEHFTLLCNVLGHTTQEAQATFIGMGWRALNRAIRGGPCGEVLVANTLAAFEQHADRFAEMNLAFTFESLFVTVAPDAAVKTTERVA
jgi:hypothetical protein